MRRDCTVWHACALLLLAGCSSAHTRDDCPGVTGSCMDPCCTTSVEPTFDAACRAVCPSGTRFVDRCAPDPSCARPDSGQCQRDGGPIGCCYGGPCCDEQTDYDVCTESCPPGFSQRCVPDPAARCAPSWLACEEPSDCSLAPAGCCLPCDEVTLDDVDAVNRTGQADHRAAVCPEGAACPPCAPPETPHLIATCATRQCAAIDLRQHPVTACTRDDECRIRVPDCCECGADTRVERLIAVRAGSAIDALVCDSLSACRGCAPVYPDAVEAYCAADGHCAVRPVR